MLIIDGEDHRQAANNRRPDRQKGSQAISDEGQLAKEVSNWYPDDGICLDETQQNQCSQTSDK